jgi:2-polyprenyl-3-methyl-5-hydroxy-6-metoxy-1,4-benzoquinol methylase
MTTPQEQPTADIEEMPRDHHTCPIWVGYLLASPLRKLAESPDTILGPFVEPGMTVVDVGCAMGFHSLPLARMVGDKGRVVCVDIQARMLKNLERRARRRKLDHIIETRKSTQEDLGLGDLEGAVDLALAANVVHETAYPRRFLTRVRELLRPASKLLLVEPKGHVSDQAFDATRRLAQDVGFSEIELKQHRRSKALILQSPMM